VVGDRQCQRVAYLFQSNVAAFTPYDNPAVSFERPDGLLAGYNRESGQLNRDLYFFAIQEYALAALGAHFNH